MGLFDYFRKRSRDKFIDQIFARYAPGYEEDMNAFQDHLEAQIVSVTEYTYDSLANCLISANVIMEKALRESLPLRCEIISFVLFHTMVGIHSATSQNLISQFLPIIITNMKSKWINYLIAECHIGKKEHVNKILKLLDYRLKFYYMELRRYVDEQKSGKGVTRNRCRSFLLCLRDVEEGKGTEIEDIDLFERIENVLTDMLLRFQSICKI